MLFLEGMMPISDLKPLKQEKLTLEEFVEVNIYSFYSLFQWTVST